MIKNKDNSKNSDNSISPYYAAIIIIFVIIIILIICWILAIKSPVEFPPPAQLTDVGYGSRCLIEGSQPTDAEIEAFNPGNCSNGLTCVKYSEDQNWGICKTSIGQMCTNLSQCVPNAVVCSDVCSITQVGGLNQQGPCNEGLSPNNYNICKLNTGESGCTTSSDCQSNSCLATIVNNEIIKICNVQQINGNPCNNNSDCVSGNCSNLPNSGNFCQATGVNSGDEDASCAIGLNIPGCNTGLECYKDLTDLSQEYGTCQSFVGGWPSYCDNSNPCSIPSICWDGECSMPRTETTFNTNSCGVNTTSSCIDGYICSSGDNGMCLPRDTVPYPNDGKWTLFKWIPGIDNIGMWKNIITIDKIPVTGTNLSCISNLLIYKNSNGWSAIYNNKINAISVIPSYEVYNTTVSSSTYTFTVDNIQITPNLGILVSYTLIRKSGGSNIYRSYLFSKIPSDFTQGFILTVGIYSLLTYYSAPVSYISIDDRQTSIRMMDIRTNNLYVGLTTIDQINGIKTGTSTVPKLNRVINSVSWAQFYSYSLTSDINEFVYKILESTEIIIYSSSGASGEINIPPVTTVPTTGSKIISQALYSPTGGTLSNIEMIYTINYPTSVGGPQLRIIENSQDVIMPGYFVSDSKCQVAISFDTGEYYIITQSN